MDDRRAYREYAVTRMKTRGGIVVVLFLLAILPVANAATETQISQTVIDPEPFRTRTVVASSGNGYLVAWGAVGLGSRENIFTNPPMTIYIRAVGADGIPLQAAATPVGKGELPSIVWNGHEYLVVWGITYSDHRLAADALARGDSGS